MRENFHTTGSGGMVTLPGLLLFACSLTPGVTLGVGGDGLVRVERQGVILPLAQ